MKKENCLISSLRQREKLWKQFGIQRNKKGSLSLHCAKEAGSRTKIPNPASVLTLLPNQLLHCQSTGYVQTCLVCPHHYYKSTFPLQQCPFFSVWTWLCYLTARVDGTSLLQCADGLDSPALQTDDECWCRRKFGVLMSLLRMTG